jgi:hypothetical protein
VISFAEFAPDRSDFDPSVTDNVLNVVPGQTGYQPFPDKASISNALASAPRGAFLARTSAGVYQTFAFTETDAYIYNGTTRVWDEISKPASTYSVPAEGSWSVLQFGDYVVATNGSDPVQYYNLATPTTFLDLPGSPPRGVVAAVVGDFLAFGNTNSYGLRSVAWSGINNAEFWTPGNRGSDYQVFPEGGEVLGIAGFEGGAVVFQDNVIREMSVNLSSPFIFNFRKTDETRTIVAPRSIVRAGGGIFFLTLEGFFRYGQPSVPIGNERVDRFFQSDADFSFLWQTQGAADPVNKVVYWRYKSVNGGSSTTTDRVLIYNYLLDKWSLANVELSWIFPSTTPGETLESLDALGFTLDTFPTPFDSRTFAGGTPLIGGFDADYKLVFFNGSPLEAVLQTGDQGLAFPRRAFVNGFRPVTDAGDTFGRVAVKDRHGGNRVWGGETAVQTTGLIPARASGRLHRFEVRIPAGTEWTHIHGVEPQATPGGNR